MLEVLRHDGPARLGKFFQGELTIRSPALISVRDMADQGSIFQERDIEGPGILPDFPSGLDVPREVAEFAVEETLRVALENPGLPAVVQGGRFPDLRLKCARELGDRPMMVMADGAKLLDRPRTLTEVVPAVREEAPPNTALYFPHAPASWFPILAYMGIDIFDDLSARTSARKGIMEGPIGTWDLRDLMELPCGCGFCSGKSPENLGYKDLLEHNLQVAQNACVGIREAIRKGILRNLVETHASASVNQMVTLRLLDENCYDFLEKYTPVRP